RGRLACGGLAAGWPLVAGDRAGRGAVRLRHPGRPGGVPVQAGPRHQGHVRHAAWTRWADGPPRRDAACGDGDLGGPPPDRLGRSYLLPRLTCRRSCVIRTMPTIAMINAPAMAAISMPMPMGKLHSQPKKTS